MGPPIFIHLIVEGFVSLLVVEFPTHLKTYAQVKLGSSSPIFGVNKKNCWNHHPVLVWNSKHQTRKSSKPLGAGPCFGRICKKSKNPPAIPCPWGSDFFLSTKKAVAIWGDDYWKFKTAAILMEDVWKTRVLGCPVGSLGSQVKTPKESPHVQGSVKSAVDSSSPLILTSTLPGTSKYIGIVHLNQWHGNPWAHNQPGISWRIGWLLKRGEFFEFSSTSSWSYLPLLSSSLGFAYSMLGKKLPKIVSV